MAKTTKYTGTQTEKNLQAAFAGESQARNKYTFFASVAKKQGYEQIARAVSQDGGQREGACQAVVQGAGRHRWHRPENLAAAAEGENYEWTDMYARALPKRPRPRASPELAAQFPHGRRGRAVTTRSATTSCAELHNVETAAVFAHE